LASRRTHYTKANPNPNAAPVVDNPNLISRRPKREEGQISQTPLIKADSCIDEWLFLEDLHFDVPFDLSPFRTRSKSALDEIFLDPEFIADLEF